MNPEEKAWAESHIGQTMMGPGGRYGVVEDYKPGSVPTATLFILKMASGKYAEEQRFYHPARTP